MKLRATLNSTLLFLFSVVGCLSPREALCEDSIRWTMDGSGRVTIFITIDAKVDKAQTIVNVSKDVIHQADYVKNFQSGILQRANKVLQRAMQALTNTDAELDSILKQYADEAAEVKKSRVKPLDPLSEPVDEHPKVVGPVVEPVPDAIDHGANNTKVKQ